MRDALTDADIVARLRGAAAVDVVAAGKAASPMLDAFRATAPVSLRHIVGVSTQRPDRLDLRIEWHAAAHPVPDERSVRAAEAVLDLAAAAATHDLLVLLLSGGASSLMALPADGVPLEDKRGAVRLLLAAGADIGELNTVRKHLSALKGGRLAAAAQGAVLTLALSDVADDDPSTIGSGPAVADPTTFDMALEVLDRRGGRARYPAAVVTRLERGAAGQVAETPKPGDRRLARSAARVIGGSRSAVEGARAAAESLGYIVHVVAEPLTGEARMAAHTFADVARAIARAKRKGQQRPQRWCVIGFGETTVRVTGRGKGGRNQEFALSIVRSLDTIGDTVVTGSIGTDGIDGPTDAAGAVADTTTLERAEAADIGAPERYLNENNSYVFFNELNDLVRTGPTGTNVGDLHVMLVEA